MKLRKVHMSVNNATINVSLNCHNTDACSRLLQSSTHLILSPGLASSIKCQMALISSPPKSTFIMGHSPKSIMLGWIYDIPDHKLKGGISGSRVYKSPEVRLDMQGVSKHPLSPSFSEITLTISNSTRPIDQVSPAATIFKFKSTMSVQIAH